MKPQHQVHEADWEMAVASSQHFTQELPCAKVEGHLCPLEFLQVTVPCSHSSRRAGSHPVREAALPPQ